MNRFHFNSNGPLLLAAIAGAVLADSSAVQANPGSPTTNALTLEALVAEALERNPELKFYEAEIDAAKAGRRTAALWSNPELGASLGHKDVRGAGLNAEGVAWSVSLLQPFEWPGRIGLRKAIANRELELANLGLSRFRASLAGRVRTLAFGLFAAQQKAAAAREVADRFGALREVLVQRVPAGLTPLLETRVIEATELNMQRKAAEAAIGAQTALLELNQLRGLSPEAPLQVAQPQLSFPTHEDKTNLLALAQTNNFEIRLRAAELAQQGFRVDLARNERFPAIALGPSYSEERAGDTERILALGVSLPLPLWNRNAGSIETARARQAQAETSYLLTQREIERKVLDATLTYDAKRREIERWRPDAIAHFKHAADLADRHYRLGAVPISTYVELQKQYLEAVEGLLDTQKEALEAAAQLEWLTGAALPPPTTLPVTEVTP